MFGGTHAIIVSGEVIRLALFNMVYLLGYHKVAPGMLLDVAANTTFKIEWWLSNFYNKPTFHYTKECFSRMSTNKQMQGF